ncbi:triose-phosphate isomerase [bacterium]|nr:MAG: triose-phosphate isomerase [bacterium]
MRTPLILGNWKMNKTSEETISFIEELKPLLEDLSGVEVGVAPPYTLLHLAGSLLADTKVLLGAQNCHWAPHGAFTGEISSSMLLEAGCAFAILGHSERRQLFGESDARVAQRARAALEAGLLPVVCVGETLAERDAGRHFDVVAAQLAGSLAGFSPEELAGMVIAYEPVWAIGTGRTASVEQAQEMHGFIRGLIGKMGGEAAGSRTRILYGGSVTPQNAASLLEQTDVDGALVGGASLDSQKFASIARFRV